MPKVGKKSFPYTPEGKRKAAAESRKKGNAMWKRKSDGGKGGY